MLARSVRPLAIAVTLLAIGWAALLVCAAVLADGFLHMLAYLLEIQL